MDLLATVRKEGSRGGRGEFNWSDVQSSSRREHYLGHSLMAPVGRYSKGRDLNWYAKGNGDDQDGEDAAQTAARERKEEIKLIKQAEEDALAKALGLPVPERNNANMEPVSDKREVDKAVKEASSLDHGAGRGIGFGRHAQASNELTETIQDVEIVMKTASPEAKAEIAKSAITKLIEITIAKGVVIGPVRDFQTGRANAVTEDVLGQEVLVKDTIGAIKIANVIDLLTDHEEMITSDADISTTVPKQQFEITPEIPLSI